MVCHHLKDKLESLQFRIDEVPGVIDLCGAKAIINRIKSIDRNWDEINKLESNYYKITGKVMKKRRAHDDIRAVFSIQGEWEDHCGPTTSNDIIELPNRSDSNTQKGVDDQKLDDPIIIDNVKLDRKWKLIPLDKPDKKSDMSSKMSYSYMRNKILENGDPFIYSNKQDEANDEWINKLMNDLRMKIRTVEKS